MVRGRILGPEHLQVKQKRALLGREGLNTNWLWGTSMIRPLVRGCCSLWSAYFQEGWKSGDCSIFHCWLRLSMGQNSGFRGGKWGGGKA